MSNPIFTNEKSTRSLSEFEFLQDPNDKNAKLGIGSFACVKLAKEKKTGKKHAIKIISMHPNKVSSSDLHNIRTEITIHRKLDHPNIVKFHDYIQKDHNVYLVLDYAESGNLYSYIHKRKCLAPEEIFRFFYQTCLAIQYLHQNDVLHRDIKPENLLLDREKNLKLCDFGWATRRITEKRLTFCGTYEYMAPEIVHKKPYDYRVDIWSLGILLYELIHREAPYKGRSLSEISKSIAKSHIDFSPVIAPEAKDLILKILKTEPTERLSIPQILSHPWVQLHLSPEQDDSLQVEEYIVSPRELKPANFQSIYGESPRPKLRRDNENFRSEIIMTSDDGIFSEIIGSSKTRKNSQNPLFSSFNMPSSVKNQERSKDKIQERERERREKGKITNLGIKSLNHSAARQKTPLQDLVSAQLHKTNEENLSSARDHIKSSPSVNNKALLEKTSLNEKLMRYNMERKAKLLESDVLSPSFRTKVDSIIQSLSSHTTSNKITDRTHSLFSGKSMLSAQTPSSEVPLGFKFFDENSHYGVSSSSIRSKSEFENAKAQSIRNHMKNAFQKKISLPKGDSFSTLVSQIGRANLTTRSKLNSRGSDIMDQENLFTMTHKFSIGEMSKPITTKNFGGVLEPSDQNTFHGHERMGSGDLVLRNISKGFENKKRSIFKTNEEFHFSTSSERRFENKENRIREKI